MLLKQARSTKMNTIKNKVIFILSKNSWNDIQIFNIELFFRFYYNEYTPTDVKIHKQNGGQLCTFF